MRRRKKSLEVRSESRLKRRVFGRWNVAVQAIQTRTQLGHVAQVLYQNQLKKRALNQWRDEFLKRKTHEIHDKLANEHHQMTLKRICWQRLVELRLEKQRRRAYESVAALFYQRKLRSHFWIHWKCRLMFHKWKLIARDRQDVRQKLAGAIETRQRNLLHVSFRNWKHFTAESVKNRRNDMIALRYSREQKLTRFFGLWKEYSTARMRKTRNDELASNFDTSRVEEQALKNWKVWMRAVETKKQSIVHSQHRILQSVFTRWRTFANRKLKQENDRRKAVRFYYYQSLSRRFEALKSNLEDELEEKMRWNNSKIYYSSRVVLQCLEEWKKYTRLKREKHQRLLDLDKFVQERTLQQCLHQWSVITAQKVLWSNVLDRSRRHYQIKMLLKTLQAWKVFSKYERLQKEEKNHVLCRNSFHRWLEYHRDCMYSRFLQMKAEKHYKQTLSRQMMSGWVEYVGWRRWKDILESRAKTFNRKRLKRLVFRRWKDKIDTIHAFRFKTIVALKHWKYAMEKRMFHKWKSYLENKHRKRERLNDAYEWHRQCLVKQSMSQLIDVGLQLRDQRLHRACVQYGHHTQKIWKLVVRIAHHWRSWAWTRAQLRKSQRAPEPRLSSLYRSVPSRSSAFTAPECFQSRERVPARRLGSESKPSSTGSSRIFTTSSRPRPRKPLEVLELESIKAEESTWSYPKSNWSFNEQMESLSELVPKEDSSSFNLSQLESNTIMDFNLDPPPLSTSRSEEIHSIEQRLVYWREQRQVWKQHAKSLNQLRSMSDQLSDDWKKQLDQMERQALEYQRQHTKAKQDITYCAGRIRELRQ